MNDKQQDPYDAPMPDLPPEDAPRQLSGGNFYDDLARRLTEHQPSQQASLNTCAECGGKMFWAKMSDHVAFIPHDAGIFNFTTSTARARVCQQCGFAKLYAADPENINPNRE